MIYLTDSQLFPSFMAGIFTELGSNGFLWATRGLALRKRNDGKHGRGYLPFLAFYRNSPVIFSEDNTQIAYKKGFVGQNKDDDFYLLDPLRVSWEYECSYYSATSLSIVNAIGKLLRATRKPNQFTIEISKIPFGYQFGIGSGSDESNAYQTEEVYEKGNVQVMSFTVKVDSWILGLEAYSGPVVESFEYNVYGYNGPDMEVIP